MEKNKNEAEILLESAMQNLKFDTFSQLASFLDITQSAINGWLQRNSIKTIKKHLRNKNVDVEKLMQNKTESLTMADVRAHIKGKDHHIKLNDNIQKILEFEATENPTTSPYSELFQILVGENRDGIFQILSNELELENVDDAAKMKFIEDFEALIKHVVSPQAKLRMLERLKGKYK